jgi:hypothetical protein
MIREDDQERRAGKSLELGGRGLFKGIITIITWIGKR